VFTLLSFFFIFIIMRYKVTKEELENAVKKSESVASVCRILNIRPVGGNYRTLHSKFKKWNIDSSHFTGQGWNVGLKFKPSVKRPLSEILVEDSDYGSISKLRGRLIKEGVKEHRCESCKLTEWLGQPIPLELDHINGINTDNRIENLKVLCPNCHAQTPNYRGRNKLSALSEKKEVKFRKFGEPFKMGIPSQAQIEKV
jgi:Zn finger protein HypA/HybF involved in hydrogenase expression